VQRRSAPRLFILASLLSVFVAISIAVVGAESRLTPAATLGLSLESWSRGTLGTVDARVFELALGAARCAVRSGAVAVPRTLSIIDYSKPSTEQRLWVFDVPSRTLLYQELVAHGQGSGDNFARLFSDEPNTHRSSLGLFVTEGTYVGHDGYSLHLNGLDPGFNDRARERSIVMHGARYVSATVARSSGRLGRSWGCPAVREDIARELIDRVKDGGLLFAYYPDPRWLSSSRFLGNCAR
jgi:L,D-transpeptidase catalytic domain